MNACDGIGIYNRQVRWYLRCNFRRDHTYMDHIKYTLFPILGHCEMDHIPLYFPPFHFGRSRKFRNIPLGGSTPGGGDYHEFFVCC